MSRYFSAKISPFSQNILRGRDKRANDSCARDAPVSRSVCQLASDRVLGFFFLLAFCFDNLPAKMKVCQFFLAVPFMIVTAVVLSGLLFCLRPRGLGPKNLGPMSGVGLGAERKSVSEWATHICHFRNRSKWPAVLSIPKDSFSRRLAARCFMANAGLPSNTQRTY